MAGRLRTGARATDGAGRAPTWASSAGVAPGWWGGPALVVGPPLAVLVFAVLLILATGDLLLQLLGPICTKMWPRLLLRWG
eukprot:2015540-Alexandrium_andersonii.AAC.1